MSSRKSAIGLGALLRLAAQAMTNELSLWIAASGFEGVKPAHSAAIQPLWAAPDGMRITDLARASRITKQTMSAMIAELEGAGYVELVKDREDARAVRVRLTDRGRAYGRAARAYSHKIEERWARRIGARRVAELRRTLERLRDEVFLAED